MTQDERAGDIAHVTRCALRREQEIPCQGIVALSKRIGGGLDQQDQLLLAIHQEALSPAQQAELRGAPPRESSTRL
jgi:hypothetical protein